MSAETRVSHVTSPRARKRIVATVTRRWRYPSLEDFLTASELTIDGRLDDGWGGDVFVKGREIEATTLFADISSFSARTADMTPTETLVYVNTFFTWITEEALRHSAGVVDKYIGDEVMVIFAKEFGSTDPSSTRCVPRGGSASTTCSIMRHTSVSLLALSSLATSGLRSVTTAPYSEPQ